MTMLPWDQDPPVSPTGGDTGTCPACRQALRAGGGSCSGCGSEYHLECLRILGGCVRLGCPRALRLRPPVPEEPGAGRVVGRPGRSFSGRWFVALAGLTLMASPGIPWPANPAASGPTASARDPVVEPVDRAGRGPIVPAATSHHVRDLLEEVGAGEVRIRWKTLETYPAAVEILAGEDRRLVPARPVPGGYEARFDLPSTPVRYRPCGWGAPATGFEELRVAPGHPGHVRVSRRFAPPQGVSLHPARFGPPRTIRWLWSLRVDTLLAGSAAVGRHLYLHDGHRLRAHDRRTGSLIWACSSPAREGEVRMVACRDGVIWSDGEALWAAAGDGSIRWTRALAGVTGMRPLGGRLEVLVEGDRRRRLVQLDQDGGLLRSVLALLRRPVAMVSGDARIFALEGPVLGPDDGDAVTVSCYDRILGSTLWVRDLPAGEPVAPVLHLTGGHVVFTRSGIVHLVEQRTGMIRRLPGATGSIGQLAPLETGGAAGAGAAAGIDLVVSGGKDPPSLRWLRLHPGTGSAIAVEERARFVLRAPVRSLHLEGGQALVRQESSLEIVDVLTGQITGVSGLGPLGGLVADGDAIFLLTCGSAGGRAGPTGIVALSTS